MHLFDFHFELIFDMRTVFNLQRTKTKNRRRRDTALNTIYLFIYFSGYSIIYLVKLKAITFRYRDLCELNRECK